MDKVAGNQQSQFYAEIFTIDMNLTPFTKEDKVPIVTNNEFPFLDMKMSCYSEGDLKFGVFSKEIQQLNCICKVITHTPNNLRTISLVFLNLLCKSHLKKTLF